MSITSVAVVQAAGSSRLILGIATAVVSAVLYDAGYVLEKQALVALPCVGASPLKTVRTVISSRRWLAGFAAMVAGLGLQVVALTLAPVSVVQPVLAGGLVGLVVAGGPLLGERLGWRHRTALLLVVGAVVALGLSSKPGARLADTVSGGSFAALTLPAVVLAGLVALMGLRRARKRNDQGFDLGAALTAWPAAALASAAGLLYGIGAVAEKAVATELVGKGVVHGTADAVASAFPWVFLAVTFGGMLVFQVALQRYPASIVATLTNMVSSVFALCGASVVFGELLLPPGWWSVARLAAFAGVAAALVLLGSAGAAEEEVEVAIS